MLDSPGMELSHPIDSGVAKVPFPPAPVARRIDPVTPRATEVRIATHVGTHRGALPDVVALPQRQSRRAATGTARLMADAPEPPVMRATAIDHVNLRFPDDRLAEVIEFYVDKLGFESGFDDPYAAVRDDPGLFALELGGGCRLFVNPSDAFDPDATNYRHVALRIPETPTALRERLDEEGIAVDSEAERERDPVGRYTSYYVSDPFGYTVELMATGKD